MCYMCICRCEPYTCMYVYLHVDNNREPTSFGITTVCRFLWKSTHTSICVKVPFLFDLPLCGFIFIQKGFVLIQKRHKKWNFVTCKNNGYNSLVYIYKSRSRFYDTLLKKRETILSRKKFRLTPCIKSLFRKTNNFGSGWVSLW